ncbi:hypothetical protein ACJMK2_026901 [Sinanodonta woodiana]|uniref:Uncharacterized protein n=1 Tax=Sinanodonta woodiana TaxID=1069815 RepID=A0ABD3XPN3_SINWO
MPMSSSNDGSSTVASPSETTINDIDIFSSGDEEIETVQTTDELVSIPSSEITSTMSSLSIQSDVDLDGEDDENEKEEAKPATVAPVESLETVPDVESPSLTQDVDEVNKSDANEGVEQVMATDLSMSSSYDQASTVASQSDVDRYNF